MTCYFEVWAARALDFDGVGAEWGNLRWPENGSDEVFQVLGR